MRTLRLMLIGDGPERENLEDWREQPGIAGMQSSLLGSLPYDADSALHGNGRCFVTASVTEVHPLTVIEAMAAGLPVLGIGRRG